MDADASASAAELLEGLLRRLGPGALALEETPVPLTQSAPPSFAAQERPKERGRAKGRRQASAGQVGLLEEVFALEPIPTALTKARLSVLLGMPAKRIQIW